MISRPRVISATTETQNSPKICVPPGNCHWCGKYIAQGQLRSYVLDF